MVQRKFFNNYDSKKNGIGQYSEYCSIFEDLKLYSLLS